jgi:hypothetical protein
VKRSCCILRVQSEGNPDWLHVRSPEGGFCHGICTKAVEIARCPDRCSTDDFQPQSTTERTFYVLVNKVGDIEAEGQTMKQVERLLSSAGALQPCSQTRFIHER